MSSRDLSTRLPMYEDLPFDEVTAHSPVSTGELPTSEQVSDVVTEAYEEFRLNRDGAVADYIPALASASPELFGISVVGAILLGMQLWLVGGIVVFVGGAFDMFDGTLARATGQVSR